MKQKNITSTLAFFLIASTAWVPSQKVGAVSFKSPSESAPENGVGGASRGLFKSNGSAPRDGVGGASRSLGLFKSNGSAPEDGVGGASRGLFKSNGSAPEDGVGGASRNLGLFKSNGSAPRDGVGGGSRGLFKSNGSAPEDGVGGSSRNLFQYDGSNQKYNVDGASGGNGSSGVSGTSRDGRRYLNYPYANVDQPAAILALLPQSYFGTTISQRPEILIYVPQSQAREAIFSLKDIDGNTIHQMNVPVSGRAEIISVNPPTDLKIDKNYKWFLALKIDGELSARTPYVDGWIKRIQPNQEIAASLKTGDLLAQAKALGKHGVWYDCVSNLAKLHATYPNNSNFKKHWSELLESVELQQIEKAPIIAFN